MRNVSRRIQLSECRHFRRQNEDATMRTLVALVAAAALLSGVTGAYAQGSGSSSGSTSNQCWDVSSNSVKNQAPGISASAGGSGSTVGSAQTGTSGTATGPTGSSGSSSGTSGTGTSASSTTTRPTGM